MSKVYQFRISLKYIKPTIWRRIQVPEDYSFLDLSNAIINAMGWDGTHTHEFRIKNPETGSTETIGVDPDKENSCSSLNEKDTKLKDFFIEKSKGHYIYSYKSHWVHEIILHKILPAVPGINYPICVDGKRACPPEDCGGVEGYNNVIRILAKPKEQRIQEENDELKTKSMPHFKPEFFNKKHICFDNIRAILARAMNKEVKF